MNALFGPNIHSILEDFESVELYKQAMEISSPGGGRIGLPKKDAKALRDGAKRTKTWFCLVRALLQRLPEFEEDCACYAKAHARVRQVPTRDQKKRSVLKHRLDELFLRRWGVLPPEGREREARRKVNPGFPPIGMDSVSTSIVGYILATPYSGEDYVLSQFRYLRTVWHRLGIPILRVRKDADDLELILRVFRHLESKGWSRKQVIDSEMRRNKIPDGDRKAVADRCDRARKWYLRMQKVIRPLEPVPFAELCEREASLEKLLR